MSYGLRVPLPAVIFGLAMALLLVAVVLVVRNASRRKRAADANIERRGWRRLPDAADVTAGWDGWPFLVARRPGRSTDVLVGEYDGVEFMSLRWSQLESGRGRRRGGDTDRYSIVALRCEHDFPHVSFSRGDHKVHRGSQHPGAGDFEVDDEGFDRRWQLLGDADFGRALLTPDVRAVMDEHDGAWVFQPGWVTRVTRWTFYSGEEAMLEELHRAAAPWRCVPHEVWRRYAGAPRFVSRLGGPGWEQSIR